MDLQIGVSFEVALSLRPRAMVGVSVDLDHEPRLRPVEVDLVAVQHRVDERLGKAVGQTEAQEGGLRRRLRAIGSAALLERDATKDAGALLAGGGVAESDQPPDVEKLIRSAASTA